MYIKKIQLNQFRNLSEVDFLFFQGLNIIYGENGVGKTSILEAIYFLSFTKSFKSKKDRDLIQKGKGYFQISTQWNLEDDQEIKVKGNYLKTGEKKFFYSDIEIKNNSEMIGKIPIVFQSPEDYVITSTGSKYKRQYFDKLISQISKEYLKDLLNYRKLLKQKNAYLKILAKRKQFYSDEQIDVYNEQILPIMWRIYSKRKATIEEFNIQFKEMFKETISKKSEVEIEYKPSIYGDTLNSFSERYYSKTKDSISKEIAMHHSMYGVNYDRINFYRESTPVENFASQGEHKLWMNIMKLTEGQIIKEKKGQEPIFLLDDVFAELDISNSQKIIEKIKQQKQVIVTATDLNNLHSLGIDTKSTNVHIIELK
ncbi:MAG: DNA replication and repair protein RecF [Candidatus Marinimicrobia bacterium]|nr:DNA replication and repair protein RecF [Candidatus Neomarinimicrobiota bacterium]